MKIAKFALVVLGALMLIGAGPLNPTVTLRSNPGEAPSDCYGEVTPTTPTAPSHLTAEELQEVPMPVSLEAPPSETVRAQLRALREARARGDRQAFTTTLDALKRTVATYPRGGERTALEDAIRVFDKVARLWEYQYESPAGAFFDESSEIYATVSGYPGYEEAIRRETFTSNGRRIYPTVETLEFLTAEANKRLTRLGVSTPATKTAERQRRRLPAIAPDVEDESKALPPITRRRAPASPSASTSTSSKPKAKSSARRDSAPSPVPSSSPSRSRHVASSSRRSAPAPVPPPPPPADASPAPVASAPTSAPTTTPAPPAADTAPAAPAVDTAEPAPVTTTTATATAAPAAQPAQPAAAPEGRGRSLLIPIILIVIGIGVLIVLFRAST